MKCKAIILLPFLFTSLNAGASESSEVNKAIDFLQTACVTSGFSLEINAEANGALSVKKIKNSGVSATVELTHKQVEGFADAASQLSASQASEMRECMKPYIERIISVYLKGSASIEPQVISLQTPGDYFVLEEFDRVMAAFAEHPKTLIRFKDALRLISLHPAKVSSYIDVGLKNNLLVMYDPKDKEGGYGYVIDKKGISYVLGKGLVN